MLLVFNQPLPSRFNNLCLESRGKDSNRFRGGWWIHSSDVLQPQHSFICRNSEYEVTDTRSSQNQNVQKITVPQQFLCSISLGNKGDPLPYSLSDTTVWNVLSSLQMIQHFKTETRMLHLKREAKAGAGRSCVWYMWYCTVVQYCNAGNQTFHGCSFPLALTPVKVRSRLPCLAQFPVRLWLYPCPTDLEYRQSLTGKNSQSWLFYLHSWALTEAVCAFKLSRN